MKRNSALHSSSHRSSKSNDSYASKESQMLKNVLVRGKLSLTLSPEYHVVRNPTCFLFSLLCFIVRITEYTWQSSVAKKKQQQQQQQRKL